jgi:hypothetical protein
LRRNIYRLNREGDMTITDDDIRRLRSEAVAAGDYAHVDICNRALADDVTDQDGNEIALADWTREEARQECERVIAAAAGMAAKTASNITFKDCWFDGHDHTWSFSTDADGNPSPVTRKPR